MHTAPPRGLRPQVLPILRYARALAICFRDTTIMIRLLRAPNMMMAQHWANLLEQANISCTVHNQYLQGALGDIPTDQCGPEIWIEHARDEVQANALIDQSRRGATSVAPNWHCPACEEWLEPQFATCWNCGASRES